MDLPDVLDVLTFNGNGAYTLREDNENGRMETAFVSKAEAGKQTVTVSVGGDACVASRKMNLEFRNIEKGSVRVYENGVLIDVRVKTDGCVTVMLPAVKAGAVYTVEVEYTENERRFRTRTVDALARLECKNECKQRILRGSWELSEEETLTFIRNFEELTENEKIYLTEEW